MEALGPEKRGRTGTPAFSFVLITWITFMVVMAVYFGPDAVLVLAAMASVLGFSAFKSFKSLRPIYIEEQEPERTFPEMPWRLVIAFCVSGLLLALAGADSGEAVLLWLGSALFGLGGAAILFTFSTKHWLRRWCRTA
ncbi:MAG: hypothetical protein ACUVT7_04365 [Thermoplasmata archaeon]